MIWNYDFNFVKNLCKENFVVFMIEGVRKKLVKKKEFVIIEVMKMLYI